RRAALRQESQRALTKSALRVLLVIMGGKSEYARLRMVGADSPQRLQATHPGHRKIQHHDVGGELEIALAGDFSGLRFRHDADLRLRLQQEAKSGAHHRVIVHEHDSNHRISLGTSLTYLPSKVSRRSSWLRAARGFRP